MNKRLELEKIGLPKPISSKPLLITINKPIPKVENIPLIIIEHPKEIVKPFVVKIPIILEVKELLPTISCEPCDKKNEDSVIDLIDTGFGCDNTLIKDCPKPKYKSHLCTENYLSEFKTESEKLLARTNLGVYSKNEISDILARIVENNNKQFVTKEEVNTMIGTLDFVNSALRSYVEYEIPSDLFKL